MKKQIFTIILFTIVSLNVLGQSFKLDATGANDMRLRTGAVDRMYIHPSTGSIGIATTSPNAKLDLNGDLALTKKLDYITAGVQNALDRQGASRIYINVAGTVTLNGIAGGVDGLIIFLYTSSAATLIINNNDPAALSANRIATHTGTTVTITARGGVSMIYDTALSNWRIFGFADENSTWNTKGNAGTIPSTNFIGTTDSQGFAIRTSNTERMRIIAGGNTGIGTPNPDTKLHVSDGSAGAVTALAGTVGTFESNTNAYLSVLSPTGALGGLFFASPSGTTRGSLLYNHATDLMTFGTASATRLTIKGTGDVGVGTITPDVKLHVEGTVDNNGTTGTFKVTNGAASMLFDGNEIDGASNGPIFLNNNSTGGVYIGANGTGLKEIIKATVSIPTFTVSANLCSSQDVSVTNAAIDSAVSASPDNAISTGLFIAYARVSSAGIVRIRICNFTAAAITQNTSDFHVAVVR
jgi:hypothetical protein